MAKQKAAKAAKTAAKTEAKKKDTHAPGYTTVGLTKDVAATLGKVTTKLTQKMGVPKLTKSGAITYMIGEYAKKLGV